MAYSTCTSLDSLLSTVELIALFSGLSVCVHYNAYTFILTRYAFPHTLDFVLSRTFTTAMCINGILVTHYFASSCTLRFYL